MRDTWEVKSPSQCLVFQSFLRLFSKTAVTDFNVSKIMYSSLCSASETAEALLLIISKAIQPEADLSMYDFSTHGKSLTTLEAATMEIVGHRWFHLF